MLILEYKVAGSKKQYSAIEEAIRIVQFISNKCVRKWMDGERVSKNDLQCYCAELAREYSFASLLNSQARQASADRAPCRRVLRAVLCPGCTQGGARHHRGTSGHRCGVEALLYRLQWQHRTQSPLLAYSGEEVQAAPPSLIAQAEEISQPQEGQEGSGKSLSQSPTA